MGCEETTDTKNVLGHKGIICGFFLDEDTFSFLLLPFDITQYSDLTYVYE